MSRFHRFAPGFALAGVLACRPQSEAADRQEIADLLAMQKHAWNRGDLEDFMAAYENSEALVFAAAGDVHHGWQATLDRYRKRYQGPDTSSMGQLDFELLDLRLLSPRSAVLLGRWKLTGTSKAAEGIFSLVLVKSEIGWRIVHDHTSAKNAG